MSGNSETMRFKDLADRLFDLPGPQRIVAIDGPGGAGKSTFAERLVASTKSPTTLLQTDAFATPDEPTAWWPRLHAVLELLAAGQPATFEPYDWVGGSHLPSLTVESASLLLIEGVSAARMEWAEHISFSIWLDASPDVCRQRGIRRDGVEPKDWDRAASDEAAFFARDGAVDRADLIVDSSNVGGFDPKISFAVRSWMRD